jgi:hypothetical protein
MSDEFRRKPRRQIAEAILVADAMTGETIGRIGNLSENGMLLIANRAMRDDALYQLRFRLAAGDGNRDDYEIGAHLLWKEPQGAPGLYWTGFRFLALSEVQAMRLRKWVGEDAAPGPDPHDHETPAAT